jgi:hypothetical protein
MKSLTVMEEQKLQISENAVCYVYECKSGEAWNI